MSNEIIGFIGVGLMGHGMARNILAAGYTLNVIAHRNRAPVEDLVDNGATELTKLADLARACTIIHICAPGSPQVEAIIEEMLPAMAPETIIVDCSTSDPGSTQKLAKTLAAKSCYMVDAPLGGTPIQAEAGQLSTMIGAPDALLDRLRPVLQSWAGAGIVHLGATGKGHQMKLLNNFVAMGYAALYSEALTLSQKAGITVEQFDSVIRGSRMDCGFYQTYMGYALEGNRDSHKFTLTNALKDMRYLASMADGNGVANPMGSAVKNSFALAVNTGGDGAQDYVPHLLDYIARANKLPDS